MERKQLIRDLNERFRDASAEEVVGYFLEAYKGRIALSSSLSIEDQTLTDIIASKDKNARIFTLDTGRLFPETYQLIDRTNLSYGIQIEVFFPETDIKPVTMLNAQSSYGSDIITRLASPDNLRSP